MPIELQIIRACEFVRLGAHGHFDLQASKAVLAEIARACRKRGIHQALIDLRAIQPGPVPIFTASDLAALVDTFQQVGFTKKDRLGILYKTDPHRRARLFSFLSTLRGWNVRSFGDFEDALLWLAGGQPDESPTQASPLEQRIPLKRIPIEGPQAAKESRRHFAKPSRAHAIHRHRAHP